MKLGIIAYATDTGLGNQTYELYRNLKPTKTLVVNLNSLNKMPVKLDRFKPDVEHGVLVVDGYPDDYAIDWLTHGVDVVFVCETPLQYRLYDRARQRGVKTIQQYNYEFLDYFNRPNWPRPDVLAAPTRWHIDNVRELAGNAQVMEWPVPVNRELIPFREITQCKTFIHIIGRPAVHDRNGTLTFLAAAAKIGRRASYKIYLQPPDDERSVEYFQPVKRALAEYKETLNLEIIENVKNYQDIYASGDVLVLPRRYGGLCLPMNEALSAGIPVIMTDVSPNVDKLPREWLIAARKITEFTPRPVVGVWEGEVNMLAYRMLEFFNNSAFMTEANQRANQIAEAMSWETLRPFYIKSLEEVCQS